MKVYALMICLGAVPLHGQFSGVMRMNCDSANPASLDDQLQRLAAPIDANDKQDIECRFSCMESLSRSQNPRALPLIARYLGIENPNFGDVNTPEAKIARPVPSGGEFPAIDYITEYKRDAVPVLIQTISSEGDFSLKAKNAARALMIVEANHPPEGVRILARSARLSGAAHPSVLLQAATFAATTWECHTMIEACRKELTPP